jgi:hypothetical protein
MHTIQMHRNSGSGFAEPKTIAEIEPRQTTQSLPFIAVGDLDGDGRRDVVARNGRFVGYILSKGEGFEPLKKARVPRIPEGEFGLSTGPIALTDVNGDESLDLIVVTSDFSRDPGDENRVFWQENQIGEEGKAFGLPDDIDSFSAPDAYFEDVAVADVNRDTSEEIVGLTNGRGLFSTGEVFVYAKGKNGFKKTVIGGGIGAPNAFDFADIGSDGSLDIIVAGTGFSSAALPSENGSGSITIFESKAEGALPEETASLGDGGASDVVLGDILGGQGLDISSVRRQSSRVLVREHQGSGFASPFDVARTSRYDRQYFVRAADINGNGRPGLLTRSFVGSSYGLLWYENQKGPGGPSQEAELVANLDFFVDLTDFDLNEDGRQDLLVRSPDTLYKIINRGGGEFSSPIPTEITPGFLKKADLNGDGLEDLILTGRDALAWIPNRDGSLGDEQVISKTFTPSRVAILDVNSDGRPDLVGAAEERSAVVWLENKKSGFGEPKKIKGFPEGSGSGGPSALAAGDISGNGRKDLAACFLEKIVWRKNAEDSGFSASTKTISGPGSVGQRTRSGSGPTRQNRAGRQHTRRLRQGRSGQASVERFSSRKAPTEAKSSENSFAQEGSGRGSFGRKVSGKEIGPVRLGAGSQTIREGRCTRIKIQDINGDGKGDILHNDGRYEEDRAFPLLFYSNLGGGRLRKPITISDPRGGVKEFGIKDFDGDGRVDIYFGQDAPKQIAWTKNQTIPPFVLGSPSGDSLVTAGDAALARRIAVGLARPNFADSLAADVSGNGAINAGDASLIEQYVVGLIEEFPTKAPGGATEGEALASGRLGRPQSTGSAEGDSPAQPMNRASGEIVWGEPEPVDSASGGASGEKEMMQVPIHLEDPQNVRAVQLELKYDPSSINVEDAEVGEVGGQEGQAEAKPWRAATNVQSDRGRVRMALSRVKPAKEGPVATLVVAVRERSPSGADALETATLEGEAVLNDGTRQPLPETDVEPAPEALTVEPPAPNPFSQATTLRYALPERQQVRIELYDVLGRRARTALSREQGAGRHAVQIGGGGLPSGTYFYRLQAGSSVRSGKLTIVR